DIGFDLYAFGPVTTDTADQSVTVAVGDEEVFIGLDDDTPVVSGDLAATATPTGQGVDEADREFRRFRVEATVPVRIHGLSVELRPTNFRGVLGTSVGVDNIDLALEIPTRQDF